MRVPTWLKITAALWAAVFLFVAFTLPPATRGAQGGNAAHVRTGVFHVHTTRSDGGGTRDDVARAAAAAGIDFVIITDHGDGTAEPAPPEYLHGVLVIDGVEVTTSAGHYAAFGLARAPYPLGGPPYAVIEDVARLGGFGAAAHPDSEKPDLRWRDWTAEAGAIEWINGDSAWRDEGPATLARGIVDFIFRPAATLAGLVERPSRLLQRLDEISRTRRVVGLAAADAHARLPLTNDEEPQRSGWSVPAPSYAQSFRTFANLVDTGQPESGDAAKDAAALARAIRDGRVAFAMTALAAPAALQFEAAGADGAQRPMGSRLAPGPMTFHARVSDVVTSDRSLVRLELRRDGQVAAATDGASLSHKAADSRGVWRVEATLAHRPGVPWLLSNPIVVTGAAADAAASPRAAESGVRGDGGGAAPVPASLDLTSGPWAIEKQAASEGRVGREGTRLAFHYRLAGGGGGAAGQFVAAARPTGSTDGWEEVVLSARADSPTRLWVQLRLSDSATGQRWGRSIYLDAQPRTIRIPLRSFMPLEARASTSRPHVAQIRAVLLVIDTVNSVGGRAGRVTIDAVRLERTSVF